MSNQICACQNYFRPAFTFFPIVVGANQTSCFAYQTIRANDNTSQSKKLDNKKAKPNRMNDYSRSSVVEHMNDDNGSIPKMWMAKGTNDKNTDW